MDRLPAEQVLGAEPAAADAVLPAAADADDAAVLDAEVVRVAVGVQDRGGLDPALGLRAGREVLVDALGPLLACGDRRARTTVRRCGPCACPLPTGRGRAAATCQPTVTRASAAAMRSSRFLARNVLTPLPITAKASVCPSALGQ